MSFTLDFDEHEPPEHMPKIDINDYFKACAKSGVVPELEENWNAGSLDTFTTESINRFGKAFVHEDQVYIVDSFSGCHNYAAAVISFNVLVQLKRKKVKFLTRKRSPIHVCNKFGGGVILVKYPDAKIYESHGHVCQPIVVKTAFCDESLSLLIDECISYITEFTTNSYAIGFKVDYSPVAFKAVLFVLERMTIPDEAKINQLDEFIKKNEARLSGKFQHVDLNEFNVAFQSNNFSKFGVNLFYKKEIDDSNIDEDITFSLDAHKVYEKIHGCLNVYIPSEEIEHTRDLWKKEFHL
ncbi:hypothetical protein BpHYR1_040903 [Brachionus plicatilis]|uniref:Uncharacterized protein n=1 Tax=Brachionus plicatilis TaxID=10195 RepID=A0A3M7QJR2_BRAPC|nr:hypothetical protein BpHYR1_040903 [Brachionus plicatilis]